MKLPFSRDGESKLKQELLRGVYEENLRIIGKGRGRALARQRPFFLKKIFLIILLTCAGVFLQGTPLTGPLFSQNQLTANPIIPRTEKTSTRPSDYASLIDTSARPLSRVFGLGVKTIMIDAGHGGNDSGTTGTMGTKEKDMTLDIAKRLRDRLRKYGRFNVVMTREDDVTLPLQKRVEMALAKRADLFISVHLNYLPARPINIIETYYFGPSSDAKTVRLAEQENAGSHYAMSDFKEVIERIGETVKLQESRTLAASIQRSLFQNIEKENGNAYDFGVKRAPFVVLLGVDVPAVLAEVSCLSNKEEEMKLNSASHRENIAHYLEAGILDYLNKGESLYEADGRTERR